MDIIGQNWIRFENNRKVKYRCSRSDFIVSGRFFDRGTWNYPEERFGRIENPLYFCTRRDGRVVDCGGLENRCAERHRGFESLSLRKRPEGRLGCKRMFATFFIFGVDKFVRSGLKIKVGRMAGRRKSGVRKVASGPTEGRTGGMR